MGGPDDEEADLVDLYTPWGWFLECIRMEWSGPTHEGKVRSYDRYTD